MRFTKMETHRSIESSSSSYPRRPPWLLRTLGSLWFAALALMLMLVAMAAATVHESQTTTEQALYRFYHSGWFAYLLALMAVSVVAVLVIRFPFTRRQIGFVLTHASVLLILGGALVSERWHVEGTLGLAEGQSLSEFEVRDRDALSIVRTSDQAGAALNLDPSVFGGIDAAESIHTTPLSLDPVQAVVDAYLPNSRWERELVNDNPIEQAAVEVSLSGPDGEERAWVFADQTTNVGSIPVAFHVAQDAAHWERLMAAGAAEGGETGGIVKASYRGASFDLTLAECLKAPAPLGDTGLTLHVHRYLPHALVGPEGKVANASDQPMNPAIDVEVTGPAGTERRFAFSKFPDFRHGEGGIEGLAVTFVAPTAAASTPIEILVNPAGELLVRFAEPGSPRSGERPKRSDERPNSSRSDELPNSPRSGELPKRSGERPISLAESVETPFDGRRLAVLQRFDRAQVGWRLAAAAIDDGARTPAIRVTVTDGSDVREIWLQKHRPRTEVVGGVPHEFTYGSRQAPLGFQVKLDRFRLGYYPGTKRPRSYESQITIYDPTAGGAQGRVVSMNHPVKYGGYTLYQSSYRQEGGRSVSFLSVSRDPGQPIVFAGYVAMLAGMLMVLAHRIADRRRVQPAKAATAAAAAAITSARDQSVARSARKKDKKELVCS